MASTVTNQSKAPPAIAAVTSASASHRHLPTSTKLDPTMAYTCSSILESLSQSHPASTFQTSSKPSHPHPPPPNFDSFSSPFSLSKPQPTIFAPTTPEKFGKKAKETCHDKPHKLSKELSREKCNDSDERMVQGMIDCAAAKDEEVKELFQRHAYLNRRLSVSLSSSSGRRRSILGSRIELRDVFANRGVKVFAADMPPFMQVHAVDCARKAHDSMQKFTSKSLALTLKKEFDGVYGSAWHCIVGTSFGSFVTHSVGGFLYFSMAQQLHILLFKTTVQRAD